MIAIIAVLIALLLPAVQQAREAARRSQCKNNLKQFGLGLHNYLETHNVFPMAIQYSGPFIPRYSSNAGGTGFSWTYYILPFVDQAPLANQFDSNYPIGNTDYPQSVNNTQLARTTLPLFRCPSDMMSEIANSNDSGELGYMAGQARTSYKGNAGAFHNNTNVFTSSRGSLRYNGFFQGLRSSIRVADIPDGLSNTIAVGEVKYSLSSSGRLYGAVGNYGSASVNGYHVMGHCEFGINPPPSATAVVKNRAWSSSHTGGAQFLIADGSVRFISENIHNTGRCWASDSHSESDCSVWTTAYDADPNQMATLGTFQRLGSRNDGLPVGDY